jgi:hypothetical protein
MGRDTYEMYLQGMSSSMPEDVQVRMMRSLPGLAGAKIMRSAYAIEYDCLDPTGLRLTLETKAVHGLYSAARSMAPLATKKRPPRGWWPESMPCVPDRPAPGRD